MNRVYSCCIFKVRYTMQRLFNCSPAEHSAAILSQRIQNDSGANDNALCVFKTVTKCLRSPGYYFTQLCWFLSEASHWFVGLILPLYHYKIIEIQTHRLSTVYQPTFDSHPFAYRAN